MFYDSISTVVGNLIKLFGGRPFGPDSSVDERLIASHARQFNSAQTVYDWQHYIDLVQRKPGALRNGAPFLDLPAPLLRLRQMLLKREGGDRVMAQVLAVVPQAGLEAVLVAVVLVLEGLHRLAA